MDFIQDFDFEIISALFPVLTGTLGLGAGLIFLVPMLFKLVKKYRDAVEELTRFIRLHKEFFISSGVQEDFKRVIKLWDEATDYTGKICRRLRMKKTADFFKNVIRDTWYLNK